MTNDFLVAVEHSLARVCLTCPSLAVARGLVDIRELGETKASEVPTVDDAMKKERESFIVSMNCCYHFQLNESYGSLR